MIEIYPPWLIRVIDETDRLQKDPAAMTQIHKFLHMVSQSDTEALLKPGSTKDGVNKPSLSIADKAAILVTLHDECIDIEIDTSDAVKNIVARHSWSKIIPKLRLALEDDLGQASACVFVNDHLPGWIEDQKTHQACLPEEWLHDVLAKLGVEPHSQASCIDDGVPSKGQPSEQFASQETATPPPSLNPRSFAFLTRRCRGSEHVHVQRVLSRIHH